MAAEIFIDTSGLYALLVRADDGHDRACDVMRKAAKRHQRFVTTDYVLDETA
jgi:predicted nucleic acid-binding protein